MAGNDIERFLHLAGDAAVNTGQSVAMFDFVAERFGKNLPVEKTPTFGAGKQGVHDVGGDAGQAETQQENVGGDDRDKHDVCPVKYAHKTGYDVPAEVAEGMSQEKRRQQALVEWWHKYETQYC